MVFLLEACCYNFPQIVLNILTIFTFILSQSDPKIILSDFILLREFFLRAAK